MERKHWLQSPVGCLRACSCRGRMWKKPLNVLEWCRADYCYIRASSDY